MVILGISTRYELDVRIKMSGRDGIWMRLNFKIRTQKRSTSSCLTDGWTESRMTMTL